MQDLNNEDRTHRASEFMDEMNLDKVEMILQDLGGYHWKIGVDYKFKFGNILRRGLERSGFTDDGTSNMGLLAELRVHDFRRYGIRRGLSQKLYRQLQKWLRRHLGRTEFAFLLD